MATYISLIKWTDQGRSKASSLPDRVAEVDKRIEAMGGRSIGNWLTMGRFDQVAVVEAPDDDTAAKMLMVVAERGSGRLLGAQIVGAETAGKRIDTLAVAIWNGMDVEALQWVDLSYAPPMSGVLDPVLGPLLSPMVASAAMTLSSVSVIVNALRLRRVEL